MFNMYRMCAFYDLVKLCALIDLVFSGPAYTWTNRCCSSKLTYEHLDK